MTRKFFFFSFFALLSINFAMAQSKDEAAVAAAVETLRKAMVDADKATLEKITAPQLSYGHSSGKVENKEEFIQAIVSGQSAFTSLTFSDQTITLAGDAAIVRHTFEGDTNDNGRPGHVRIFVLTVWQKQKGNWVLLARQAVRPPQR
jgi:ketosteroid isomerase-like protein